jgi:hypothetical protein
MAGSLYKYSRIDELANWRIRKNSAIRQTVNPTISLYLPRNNGFMDKRITTLIFIFVVYLLLALTMVLSTTGQKVLTMFLFGISGLGIFFLFFFLWLMARKD